MMDRSGDDRLQLALDAAGMGTFVWYAREDRTEPDAVAAALDPDGPRELRQEIRVLRRDSPYR